MNFNHLKAAIRNLQGSKAITLLNVLGLSLGLAACICIGLYIAHELSFDKQFAKAGRIIRVEQVHEAQGNVRTPGLLAGALREEVRGIEEVSRFITNETVLAVDDLVFSEPAVAFADAAFLTLFDFEWLMGNPGNALAEPSSVVLTQSLARKYFGEANPLGRSIEAGAASLRVTGVIADLPANTHLRLSAIASMDVFADGLDSVGMALDTWNFWFVATYALLEEDTSLEAVQGDLRAFADGDPRLGMALEAVPLEDIHLYANGQLDLSTPGNPLQLLIFGGIAFCVLLIGVFNFINLATARAADRGLEVQIRKIAGASHGQLFGQFLAESALLVMAAMLLALVIAELMLPVVNASIGANLSLRNWINMRGLMSLIIFAMLLTLAVGAYPAFFLTTRKPRSLENGAGAGNAGRSFKQVLILLQFAISIGLIIAVAIIRLQMDYVLSRDPGFDAGNVIVVNLPGGGDFDVNIQWEALRASLVSSPDIRSVAHAVSTPLLSGNNKGATVYKEGESGEGVNRGRFVLQEGSAGYLQTYGLELVEGRWIDAERASDRVNVGPGRAVGPTGAVVLNERAVRDLGWTAREALGRIVSIGNQNEATVVGVVKDTMASALEEGRSIVFYSPRIFDYRFGASLGIRTSGEDSAAMRHLESVWEQFLPGTPLNWYYLSERMEAQYRTELQQMDLASLAALLAILIASFGLHGLAAFNVQRRIKEIGIRKVLGGSVRSIILLLTNDFGKLVLISNVIAWPVAYVAMNRWLENFAYRIDLSPLVFIGSGLIALCIAWVTVGGTAAKAASAKPVLALRHE